MPNNLVSLYCKGTGKRFRGDPCDHYELFTDECRLLRQGKTARVFDQGRCEPAGMLTSAIARHLKSLWYIIIPKEHQKHAGDRKYKKSEYINFIFNRLVKNLRNINLENCTLRGLAAYISKASRNEILSVFSIYPRKQCGECQFLSLSKPYTCQKSEEHQERVPSAKKCDDFRPFEWEFVPIEDLPGETPVEPDTQIYIKEMQVLLARQIERARDKHAKKRYQRQHTLFVKYAHLLREGESPSRARKQIAEMLGKDEKTIRNDIKDIRTFFEKKFLKS